MVGEAAPFDIDAREPVGDLGIALRSRPSIWRRAASTSATVGGSLARRSNSLRNAASIASSLSESTPEPIVTQPRWPSVL
jgi:hypothetical protein